MRIKSTWQHMSNAALMVNAAARQHHPHHQPPSKNGMFATLSGGVQHHHEHHALHRSETLGADGRPRERRPSESWGPSMIISTTTSHCSDAQLPPPEERLVEGSLPKMMRELLLLCSIRDRPHCSSIDPADFCADCVLWSLSDILPEAPSND